MTDLRKALAQPERNLFSEIKEGFEALEKRGWVGLTDEEIEACFEFIIEEDWQAIRFARLIETKLKDKNHG